MGVGAGLNLLKDHQVDGIIVGTGHGGLEDCVKFLSQIIEWEEGRLTPTNFVQSTANATAGTLALMSQNSNYNTTHIHKGLAFDNALLDAQMRFEEGKGSKLLVGAVEELSNYNFNIEWQAGRFKSNEDTIDSTSLLNSETKGAICGEGSCFFIASSEQSEGAVILDWTAQYTGEMDDPTKWIASVLNQNGVVPDSVDAIIDGRNGSADFLPMYQKAGGIFPNATKYAYKHYVGEYPSSSAFATWLGIQVLEGTAPEKFIISGHPKKAKSVLIYNSYLGRQHGLIFLKLP